VSVSIDLSGKAAIVFGVANHRSIAWGIAQQLHEAGAHLTLTYQNERFQKPVRELTERLERANAVECDVMDMVQLESAFDTAASAAPLAIVVHSVAFAQRDDLEGEFSKTTLEGFHTALGISAYSLVPMVRFAAERMPDGGSVIAMSFHASEKVYPSYDVMGVAKAALENEVMLLAAEYGPSNVRVNAISSGPIGTLAARGIRGFTDMQTMAAERAPLKRNVTQEEVGKAALFLSSSLASGVTGQVLYVDAGYSIMGA